MTPSRDETKHCGIIVCWIKAHSKESLDLAIDRYFKDYAYGGYKTEVRVKPFFDTLSLEWKAELKRYASCD